MKAILPFSFTYFRQLSSRASILLLLVLFSFQIRSSAQCAGGYISATLDWDNVDYFHQNGAVYGGINPVTGLAYVTTAMAQTQYFALGTNKLTLSTTIALGSSGGQYGEITDHTGETGSHGSGADIKLMGNGTVTFGLSSAAQNVRFSIYDIDYNQQVTVTALNGASAVNIVMARVNATNLTITGSGTTSAAATANATYAAANNSADGTANVDIAGPVTSITLTITQTGTKTNGPASGQEDGGFFLSDFTACVASSGFPTSYYSPYTTPFTNQPAYFLANPQNLHMYMVNASTGAAHYLFSDPGGTPAGTNKMNSIAYDPVNHWIYYAMDNATQYPGNLMLKKYDVTTGTISTVISNIATFGIPSFIQGVEYAGAAFYNGQLYLGIEGSDGTSYSTHGESVVWRIDFDGSGNPTGFCQAFGTPGDNGAGSPRHDWGDFIIKDGILITHATGPTTASNHFIHYNLQTGASTSYSGSAIVAGQFGQTYNGNSYRVNNSVALYNNDGTVGATTAITVTSCSPAWSGNAGDASDPFKPMCDFGDAPATYDPAALTVAANQRACNYTTLRIGSTWGDEWSKSTSSDASGDDEEDGIATVTTMVSDGVAYNHVQDVVVLNNTGADAYLAGWLDYDADGVFEASEGVLVTVPTNASPQTISLGWTGITVAIGTPNSFLRVRLSSTPLTINNATGWFADGETEDYPVISQQDPLMIQLLDFNASLTRDKNVLLTWKAYADDDALGFEIQRSHDQNNWESIGWVDVNRSAFTTEYNFTDQQPLQGKSYYRLKMVEKTGSSRHSQIRLIQLDQLIITKVKLYPNPARKDVTVSFNSTVDQTARLIIRSTAGVTVLNKTVLLKQGENGIQLSTLGLSNGLYLVELSVSEKTFINRLTVAH